MPIAPHGLRSSNVVLQVGLGLGLSRCWLGLVLIDVLERIGLGLGLGLRLGVRLALQCCVWFRSLHDSQQHEIGVSENCYIGCLLSQLFDLETKMDV